jgi:hypothetical protein
VLCYLRNTVLERKCYNKRYYFLINENNDIKFPTSDCHAEREDDRQKTAAILEEKNKAIQNFHESVRLLDENISWLYGYSYI